MPGDTAEGRRFGNDVIGGGARAGAGQGHAARRGQGGAPRDLERGDDRLAVLDGEKKIGDINLGIAVQVKSRRVRGQSKQVIENGWSLIRNGARRRRLRPREVQIKQHNKSYGHPSLQTDAGYNVKTMVHDFLGWFFTGSAGVHTRSVILGPRTASSATLTPQGRIHSRQARPNTPVAIPRSPASIFHPAAPSICFHINNCSFSQKIAQHPHAILDIIPDFARRARPGQRP